MFEEYRQARPSREVRRSLGKTWTRDEKGKRSLLKRLVSVWHGRNFPHLIEALVSQMQDDFENDPDVGFCSAALRTLPEVARTQGLTGGTPRLGDDTASGKYSSNSDEATPSLRSASPTQSIAPRDSRAQSISWESERSVTGGRCALQSLLETTLSRIFQVHTASSQAKAARRPFRGARHSRHQRYLCLLLRLPIHRL